MLLLDKLLAADNFGQAVNALAVDFRREHDLQQIHQLGLVVPDVEEAAKQLEKNGIGPFFISSGSLVRWDERGQPGRFRGKLGLATHQGIDLELLEPGEGSDFYRQHLDPSGGIVIQHLGFFVKDVDKEMGRLNTAGYPTWVRGKIEAGPFAYEFAYMDTISTAQAIIEFIQFNALGIPLRPFGLVYHLLGRLEKLLGVRCVHVD
ncbi:MAG: VOC family protein [Myxococcota bacterium]|nr:VOC family protein [Myxococcota bacterium]